VPYRSGRSGHLDYRAIDPVRAHRIQTLAIPLGLGSLALGALLAGGVVYLALTLVPTVPLLAMTAGTHGATALIGICFGVITVSMRSAVSAGRLELGSANAIRRNLLVLWNISLLMACLGWLTLGAGFSMARLPIGTPAILTDVLVPAVLAVYNGTVAVLVSRLLRS
jgi:hypothetical protein